MTTTIVRLVLAMMLLPAAGAVFLLGMLASLRRAGPPSIFALLGVWSIVYTFVAIYWILLWNAMVRWTPRRLALTGLATLVSLVIGGVVGLLSITIARSLPPQLPILIGGGTVPIAWVLGCVLVWRETPAERTKRLSEFGSTVVCPLCGYNLTGLRQAVCPECGGSFTLDQLVAAQPRAPMERTQT